MNEFKYSKITKEISKKLKQREDKDLISTNLICSNQFYEELKEESAHVNIGEVNMIYGLKIIVDKNMIGWKIK